MTRARLAAQLLAGPPATTPAAVARRLLAVQAQDLRGAKLAIRARSAGLRAADVDRGLADRSLVVSWLNRGTLHLVEAGDYWWLHALTTPRFNNARRLAQEGVTPGDADRAVAVLERSLVTDGPLTRGQLRERIAAAGVRTGGQALVHILALAAKRGITLRGPVCGPTARDQAFVLARDWLGAPPAAFDRDRALAELARRYLAGHGPATDRDLARWAGLPLRDARRGLAAIAPTLAELPGGLVDLAGRDDRPGLTGGPGVKAGHGLTGHPGRDDRDGLPPPRLLGPFEPLLLGWSSREPIVGPHGAKIAVGGLFRPFALAGGRAVATWALAGGTVSLTPFAELVPDVSAALAADAADVTRFLA